MRRVGDELCRRHGAGDTGQVDALPVLRPLCHVDVLVPQPRPDPAAGEVDVRAAQVSELGDQAVFHADVDGVAAHQSCVAENHAVSSSWSTGTLRPTSRPITPVVGVMGGAMGDDDEHDQPERPALAGRSRVGVASVIAPHHRWQNGR